MDIDIFVLNTKVVGMFHQRIEKKKYNTYSMCMKENPFTYIFVLVQ